MANDPIREPELEQVFDTPQESEANVVQALLESEGIESILATRDAPQDVLPGVGGIALRVNAKDAQRARQLIEDYRANADAEGGERAGEETQF